MTKNKTTLHARLANCRRGFTLMELLIVMGIILLISAITIPSISAIMSTGADVQTANMLSGQLSAARGGAILEGTYWAVHIQLGTEDREDLKNTCFSAVMKLKRDTGLATSGNGNSITDTTKSGDTSWDANDWAGAIVEITSGVGSGQWGWVDSNSETRLNLDGNWQGGQAGDPDPDVGSAYRVYRFKLADGYAPEPLPGNMAVGKLVGGGDGYVAVDGETYTNLLNETGVPSLRDFASLTLVFSPQGQLVTTVYNKPSLPFGDNDPLFSGDTKVWDLPADEPGVSAVTLFSYSTARAIAANERANYLNENGQFLPINAYTGQLYPRR